MRKIAGERGIDVETVERIDTNALGYTAASLLGWGQFVAIVGCLLPVTYLFKALSDSSFDPMTFLGSICVGCYSAAMTVLFTEVKRLRQQSS
ncbi:MAG: hypothetical protein CMJ78_24395 [Planctomycetaceae bacterium]|nr:hypothetical protein [Planctomycetaceae bacterium]